MELVSYYTNLQNQGYGNVYYIATEEWLEK